MSDPIPFEDPWDGNAECRFCDEQAMHRGDCPWLLRLLAERDAQAEQIAQIRAWVNEKIAVSTMRSDQPQILHPLVAEVRQILDQREGGGE